MKIIALVAASSVTGFFLVELIVRLLFPQQLFKPRLQVWAPAETFGYRHPANADTEVDVYGPRVHFVTDDDGYRINTEQPARTCEPETRILFLGDSFVEGLKVEEDQTLSELTEEYLAENHSLCAQIDNSGVSGWNPNHYYLEAKRALRLYRYDLGVVFLYLGNDIIQEEIESFPPRPATPHHKLRFPRGLGATELTDALVRPVNDYLRSRSHFYMMVKSRVRIRINEATQGKYFPEFHKISAGETPRWDVTASVCKKIQDEFGRRQVPVFFVFLPVYYHVYTDEFHSYVERCGIDPNTVDVNQPQTLLGRACAARGLRVLDPLEVIRDKSREGVQMYKGGDPHFSVEGNEFLAEYVTPFIVSQLAARGE